MISAKNVLTTVNPFGVYLSTLEVTMPKFLVAEFNTHRQLSRNSGSSRAIPFVRLLEQVMTNPYIPAKIGRYNTGMQPAEYLEGIDLSEARGEWVAAARQAAESALCVAYTDLQEYTIAQELFMARDFHSLEWPVPDVAKELVNRILEPWMMTTIIVSATEWDNFLELRDHPDAQTDIQQVARAIRLALEEGRANAQKLEVGEWHVPYKNDPQATPDVLFASAGRCAKVSYLTHDKDMSPENVRRLAQAGHWSPFEHVARVATFKEEILRPYPSNFVGYNQMRHLLTETLDIEPPIW